MLSFLTVSDAFSFLVCQKAKNISLLSIQVGYVKAEKVAAPAPTKQALTCLVLVCLFLNSHILYFEGLLGEVPIIN